jgi:hypothetical protein
MNVRRLFFAVSLCLLGLSLVIGYHDIGNTIGLLISGLSVLAWMLCWRFAGRVSVSGFASGLLPTCLFVSVGLAVSGLMLGAPALPMIGAASLSLAVWDLLALDMALSGQSLGEQGRRYEARHLRSLGMALGSGALLIGIARLVSFRVPFVMLLFLVAAVVFALDRLWGAIKTRRSE